MPACLSLNVHPVAARIATFSGASLLCDVRKPNSVLAYVDFTSVNNCKGPIQLQKADVDPRIARP